MNSVNQIADKIDKFCRDNNVRVVCALDDSDDQISVLRGDIAEVQTLISRLIKDAAKEECINPLLFALYCTCEFAVEQFDNLDDARDVLASESASILKIVKRVQEVSK